MSVGVGQHAGSQNSFFEVEGQVESHGRNPNTGRERFYVYVKIYAEKDGSGAAIPGVFDKFVGFHCESKSLENCFEAIAVFAQQVKGLDDDKFDQFMNKVNRQRIYCDIQRDEKKGESIIKGLKYNRYGTELKLAYAPHRTKRPGFQPQVTLKKEEVNSLRDYARRKQLTKAKHPSKQRLRIDVNRNNNA